MEIYVPSGINETEALKRTTHLALAAHQDDIEIMAYDGVLKCFGLDDKWFTGVVVNDGAGSPRSGIYADCTNEDMVKIRKVEQKKAALVGEYSAQIFLDYPSADLKSHENRAIVEDLKKIILETQPEYIYTHNLADKHPAHVGVVLKTITALRELDYKPKGVYGCEVWRGLDWMDDGDKVKFNVEGREHLANALLGVFDSQIAGGKRYDLATAGRRIANATYAESLGVDESSAVIYAMDLTPLSDDKTLDVVEFVSAHLQKFADDVKKMVGGTA